MSFAGKTAIVGIGATEFSKFSGRSTLRLAVECSDAAIRDAGLRSEQIDGIVSYTVDENHEIDVARSLGIPELTHFSRIHHSGGAACGTIHAAAMAVASGAANYVLVYRAFNERSEFRFGAGVQDRAPAPTPTEVDFGWSSPFGLLTPASWVAMFAQRGLWTRLRRVPQARGEQPGGFLLPEADHARGSSEQPLDRKALAPARLLSGDRRRTGHGRHDARAGARSRPAAGRRALAQGDQRAELGVPPVALRRSGRFAVRRFAAGRLGHRRHHGPGGEGPSEQATARNRHD